MGLTGPEPVMLRRTALWRGRCAEPEFSKKIRVLAFISIFAAGASHADSAGDAWAEIARCAGIAAAQPATGAPDRDGFGFSPLPAATRVEDFGKPPVPPGITRITATVIELARTARGRSIFVLDNGQVWRQLDGDDADVLDLRPGKTMKVAIEMSRVQRLIGGYSFKLTIEGRNGFVRVYRVK